MNTDGTGFQVVRKFEAGDHYDSDPFLQAKSKDGAFYFSLVKYNDAGEPLGYIFRLGPSELRLAAARIGSNLHLTATGTTNTQWRLESRDTVTGVNPSAGSEQAAWQPLTNITLSPSPTVIQQPLSSTNRFYRGAWMP